MTTDAGSVAAADARGYMETFLTRATMDQLEAGAYRQLCGHLRERSDEVPNIDLMTVSGFCRNCLAKWLVVEARTLSERLKRRGDGSPETLRALDALGYDEAAKYVYGMDYGDWKKRHMKKATEEVLEKYEASKAIHARHDEQLLAKRGEKPPIVHETQSRPSLASNVCCQDPENLVTTTTTMVHNKTTLLEVPKIKFRLGILTISDRASQGHYPSGDLSGPAVADAVAQTVQNLANVEYELLSTAIVPDDTFIIQQTLREMAASASVDLILTTGGTGFGPRDVTPEATRGVLDQECPGLMAFVADRCSHVQPLAALSRGTAGVLGRTLVANLPGNPRGVGELVPLLLPLLWPALVDLQQQH